MTTARTSGTSRLDDVELRRCMMDLSLLEESGSWVVGNRDRTTFVAVPPVGACVIRWLAAGVSLEVVGERTRRMMGEAVDVEGFLRGLHEAGILTMNDRRRSSTVGAPIGRLLLGPTHLLGWLLVVALGGCLLLTDSMCRPTSSDAIVVRDPLGNLLLLALISTICTVLHEAAHTVTASARGVPSHLTIGRRLYFVTAVADLTALWAIPRRQRYLPLLAGMAVDVEIAGLLVVCENLPVLASTTAVLAVIRAVVLVQVSAVLFQGAVFMRTDLYAVIATASGSNNFWQTKTALLRSLCRLPDRGDRAVLNAASPRELRWTRCYLVVFVFGNVCALLYLIDVLLPGLAGVVSLCMGDLAGGSLADWATWLALAALGLVVLPAALAVAAFTMSVARALRGQGHGRT